MTRHVLKNVLKRRRREEIFNLTKT